MVVDSGFILYQQEVSDKTNEILVMQSLLRQLSVKRAIITADYMLQIKALFRRALLFLIKAHSLKDSVAGKMIRAGWDSKFRAEIQLVKNQAKYNPALNSSTEPASSIGLLNTSMIRASVPVSVNGPVNIILDLKHRYPGHTHQIHPSHPKGSPINTLLKNCHSKSRKQVFY